MSNMDRMETVEQQCFRCSELELESGVAGNEADALVEPVCVGPGDARCQLDECASPSSRLLDRPAKKVGDESGASFFFSSRRRHTIFDCDWSSDVCSSD